MKGSSSTNLRTGASIVLCAPCGEAVRATLRRVHLDATTSAILHQPAKRCTQKMASAAEQKALSNPSQLNPEGPFEDSEDRARGPAKAKPYRFGFLKLDDVSHKLRLRSRLQLRDKLFAEVGADLNVSTQKVEPKTALEYRVFRKDSHFATLRADKRALYIQKSFPINLFDKVTARLQTTVASTYDGVPELGFGLEQVKPNWLIPLGAVALLATKGKVSAGKTFAGTKVQIPVVNHDSNLKGEVNASVLKTKNGLALSLNQLNAILWI